MVENFNKKLEKYFKKRKICELTTGPGYTKASVAVVLNVANNKLFVFFIKRTENAGDSYSGHVAFPGGKMSKVDAYPLDTAVRETAEEIGVDLNEDSTYLGRLDDLKPLNPNGPKFIVSPFVFILNKEITININKDEVERYMWISFAHLSDINNLRIRHKERDGEIIEDYVYRYQKYLIWGMTGRIVNSFIKEVSVII